MTDEFKPPIGWELVARYPWAFPPPVSDPNEPCPVCGHPTGDCSPGVLTSAEDADGQGPPPGFVFASEPAFEDFKFQPSGAPGRRLLWGAGALVPEDEHRAWAEKRAPRPREDKMVRLTEDKSA